MENMNKQLQLIFGDAHLGVKGTGFHYLFAYGRGLESLYIEDKEWLCRTPMPTFWRALTDNDRGNRFQFRSGMWASADLFVNPTGFAVSVDGKEIPRPVAPVNNKFTGNETAQTVEITFTYETITTPKTTVLVSYLLHPDGKIQVKAKYNGKEGLPELPVFGMRFIMPTKAVGFCYDGLSGETYPDRRDGGVPGTYYVEGLPVTPYLVPQECGMHVETNWVEIYRDSVLDNRRRPIKRTGLRIEKDQDVFAFSCLPYTALELENARHQEELPPERYTVLCVCGAVRGVGGIDSWGAPVEEAYRISGEKDHEFSFVIMPGDQNCTGGYCQPVPDPDLA